MKKLQIKCLSIGDHDISGYFLIGSDGSVFEGRGWNTLGQQTASKR